jgi:hypothetical protein
MPHIQPIRALQALVITLLLASAALTAGALHPSTASAATCYGDYCSGQNPYDSGCANDAYAWADADVTNDNGDTTSTKVGDLYLMVSPSCGTRWARLELHAPYTRGGTALQTIQDTGYTQDGGFPTAPGTYYTEMTYSRDHCSKASFGQFETGCATF